MTNIPNPEDIPCTCLLENIFAGMSLVLDISMHNYFTMH